LGKTQGTETSKYLEEKRTIVILLVVASENGTALKCQTSEWNRLGRRIEEGDNPVHEANLVLIEYGEAGETLSEDASTIW
jgi:hypothetical protein